MAQGESTVTSYQSIELGKFLTKSEMLLRASIAPQLIRGTPEILMSLLLRGFTSTPWETNPDSSEACGYSVS